MSFVNPFFLAAIGTALLPVFYHLVRRMRADKVQFSSLMFLKATPKELVRKRRIRDWLLLLLRSLIFALLALAFARPFLPQDQLPFADVDEQVSTVILVDNSYSMRYGSLFETARSRALARLSQASAQDEFAVVTFADDVHQLTTLDADRSVHETALRTGVEASYRPTDFHPPLQLAEEILSGARHETRRIVLISDFQNMGWTDAMNNWKLSPDIEFIPIKVSPPSTDNRFVEAVELTQQRKGSRVVIQYGARVRYTENDEPDDRGVALSVDGTQLQQAQAGPASSGAVRFQQVVEEPGVYQGSLTTTAGDELAVDDAYYFTYSVDDRPSLLVIDGSPAGTRGADFFLRRAIDIGEQSLFDYSTGTLPGLSASLEPHDVVFLTDVPTLSPAQIESVREFVSNGGSIVFSFGESTNVQNISSALQRLGAGQLAAPGSTSSAAERATVIGDTELTHPIFETFARSGGSPIFRSSFRRYLKLEPDSSAAVLGRYSSGDPFLIEQSIGRGRLLVFTSSLSTAWTDFPISETFVPLIYQTVSYAASEANERRLYEVGNRVPLAGPAGDEWEVRTPNDDVHSVTMAASGTGYFSETETPGHYVAARGNEQFRFSVNLDTRESDLASRDREEAYAAIVPGTEQRRSNTTPSAAAIDTSGEEQEQKLWRTILLVVIGLFMLETIVANRRLSASR